MKTRFMILGLVLCLMGCSDKQTKEETFQDKMIGKWKITSVHAMGSDMTSQVSQLASCVMETTIELKVDGSYEYIMPCSFGQNSSGKYYISEPDILLNDGENTQTLSHDNGILTTKMEINVSDLGISLPIPSLEMTCTFEKSE